jgi:hypothetical protein
MRAGGGEAPHRNRPSMSLVNPLAIVLATVAGMAVGAIWFARPVFGAAWRRLAAVGPDAPTRPAVTYGGALVATALFAAAVAIAAETGSRAWSIPLPAAALAAALVLWIGVAVARPAVASLFEGHPVRLFLIHSGHDLVVALVVAAIIGFVGR